MEDELAVGIPDDPGPVRYHGRRRLTDRTGQAAQRRLLLVAAAVGAMLIGTSALATTLPPPVTLLTPATGTGPAAGDPAAGISRLGTAPSPAGSPDPSSPVTGPQPPPTSSAPAGSRSPIPTPTGSGSPPPVSLAFEAEAAELSGFVQIFDVTDASGGEVVGLVGVHSNNHVLFDGITVDSPGEYELTLRYVSAPARDAELIVNGGEPATVEFPALGDWRTVGSVSVTVTLVAGANKIQFGQSGRPAPALDQLTIDRPGSPDDAGEPGDAGDGDAGESEDPGGDDPRGTDGGADPDGSGDPGDTGEDPDGADPDGTGARGPAHPSVTSMARWIAR